MICHVGMRQIIMLPSLLGFALGRHEFFWLNKSPSNLGHKFIGILSEYLPALWSLCFRSPYTQVEVSRYMYNMHVELDGMFEFR